MRDQQLPHVNKAARSLPARGGSVEVWGCLHHAKIPILAKHPPEIMHLLSRMLTTRYTTMGSTVQVLDHQGKIPGEKADSPV